MPGTPKTPRGGGPGEPLRRYRSDASIRKPEPIIAEELPPLDLQHLKQLKRMHEPATTWLEDESPPESRERTSQIGIAISAPTSPANNNPSLVSPWREPTFLRDADDDSIQSEENRRKSRGWSGKAAAAAAPPQLPPLPQQQQQLSIPLSRFNNGSTAGSSTAEHKRRMSETKSFVRKKESVERAGHRRHTSETGSFTQIWSDGRRPSIGREAPPNAKLTLGQSARPGRDYSHYVAPIRRGSAA